MLITKTIQTYLERDAGDLVVTLNSDKDEITVVSVAQGGTQTPLLVLDLDEAQTLGEHLVKLSNS